MRAPSDLAREDGRRVRGERSRRAIARRAAELASIDGLDGLSIGRLADDLHISKAGVQASFGSKEALQLATIDTAIEIFIDSVVTPALRARDGVARLEALCEHWLDYARRRVFPGGCFFQATTAEQDAKPGPVRARLADARRSWLELYERAAQAAVDQGEIRPDTDLTRLARQLDAVGMAANLDALLLDDDDAFNRAAATMRDVLRSVMTDMPPVSGRHRSRRT